ncbi:MAG: hypothetical protein ACR2LL_11425 [Nitrosopumilus sp.]
MKISPSIAKQAVCTFLPDKQTRYYTNKIDMFLDLGFERKGTERVGSKPGKRIERNRSVLFKKYVRIKVDLKCFRDKSVLQCKTLVRISLEIS